MSLSNDETHSSRLFVPWVAFAGVCTVTMWLAPGDETVPYHLAWVALAVAYGAEAWPWAQTVTAVAIYTVVTGAVFLVRAATGVIAWEETTEIPMMSGLVLLVVWSIRSRHVAFGSLTRLAEKDRLASEQRERLSRMTSHEMRTPATIAMGYTEMLLSQESDPQRVEDLLVIRDELGRLVMAGDRLLRTIRMPDLDDLREHDLQRLLQEVAHRWQVLAERTWVVTCEPITHACSADRLRACLDTLVENAVRYTAPGDTVRIHAEVSGGEVTIGVADSGPGMDPLMMDALCSGSDAVSETEAEYRALDPKAQTGLGLALVREVATARGGRMLAGRAAEGGVDVAIVVPFEGTMRAEAEGASRASVTSVSV